MGSSRLGLTAVSILLIAATGPFVGYSAVGNAAAAAPAASGTTSQSRPLILIPPILIPPIPNSPSITLSLSVGPPGTVTTVTGSGFPGLQPVQLQWSRGVQYLTASPIIAHDDGTFETQFLVVFGDGILGRRYLEAAIPAFGVASESLVVARAPFLVVPHTAGPPVADIIRLLWRWRPFFFRQ